MLSAFLLIGVICVTVGVLVANHAERLSADQLTDLRPARPGLWTGWLVMTRNGLRLRALALVLFGLMAPVNFALLVFAPQTQPYVLLASGGLWVLVAVAMGFEQMVSASRSPR